VPGRSRVQLGFGHTLYHREPDPDGWDHEHGEWMAGLTGAHRTALTGRTLVTNLPLNLPGKLLRIVLSLNVTGVDSADNDAQGDQQGGHE
jgi:hypothetical protein